MIAATLLAELGNWGGEVEVEVGVEGEEENGNNEPGPQEKERPSSFPTFSGKRH